jgi:hypothetical protein
MLLEFGLPESEWIPDVLETLLAIAGETNEQHKYRLLRMVVLTSGRETSTYLSAYDQIKSYVVAYPRIPTGFAQWQLAKFLVETPIVATCVPAHIDRNSWTAVDLDAPIVRLTRAIFWDWFEREFHAARLEIFSSLAYYALIHGSSDVAERAAEALSIRFPEIVSSDKAIGEKQLKLLARSSMMGFTWPTAARDELLRSTFERLSPVLADVDPEAAQRARHEGFVPAYANL